MLKETRRSGEAVQHTETHSTHVTYKLALAVSRKVLKVETLAMLIVAPDQLVSLHVPLHIAAAAAAAAGASGTNDDTMATEAPAA